MSNLKVRVIRLEQAYRQAKGFLRIVVQKGETKEQAFERMGISPAMREACSLVIIVNRYAVLEGANIRSTQ